MKSEYIVLRSCGALKDAVRSHARRLRWSVGEYVRVAVEEKIARDDAEREGKG